MQLKKYGTAVTIRRPLILNGAFLTSATIAAGDVKISMDGDAFENLDTTPSFSEGQLAIALSATEMQAAEITVRWVDQTATKLWDDDALVIETYGDASARHEEFPSDAPSAADIEAALVNEGDATALLQAIANKIEAADITPAAIAIATRDAILDRGLSGNHETADTLGAIAQAIGDIISSGRIEANLTAVEGTTAFDGQSAKDLLLLFASVLLGKSSNGGNTFRDLADTKARVTATVDASNNRTAITLDPD